MSAFLFQFCLTVSISFLFLNFIARNVSGYLFAYLLVLFSFFGPLAVSQLPRKYVESLKDTIQTISRGEGKSLICIIYSGVMVGNYISR